MSCHETLLARKKKQASLKAKIPPPLSASNTASGSYDVGGVVPKRQASSFKDKSLPSLPPKEDPDGHISPPPSISSHQPASSVISPPSRPSKPPYDPSISRGVVRNSSAGSFTTSSTASSAEPRPDPGLRDSTGYAPIVSVSQSSPVYSFNNNANGTSTTLTETRNIVNTNHLSTQSAKSGTNEDHSSRLSTDSSHLSDYYDSLQHPPKRTSVQRKQPSSSHDGLSLPAEDSLRLSQSSARGGIYLDTLSISSDSEGRSESLDIKTSKAFENLLSDRSMLRHKSPRRRPVSAASEDDNDDSSSSPHTPIRETPRPLVSKKPISTEPPVVLAQNSNLIPQIPLAVESQEEYNPYFSNGVTAEKSEKEAQVYGDNQLTTPPFSLDSYLFDENIPEPSFPAATRELLDAQKRIAELEQKLRDKEDKSKPDVKVLESNIMEKRKTIAGLEAKGEVAKKELRMLEEARTRKGSIKESSTDLVAAFTHEVSRVKTSLQAEIESLVIERDRLLEETANLARSRDGAVEEISILNLKNNQLLDLHHELTRQIIDKYGPYVKPHAFSLTKNTTKDQSSDSLAAFMSGGDSSASMPPINDEPLVTVLDGGDDKKDRQTARRFWKRPIAKGVKGFNKVFTQETNSISSGPYVDGEVNNVQHVTAINSGNGAGVANYATIKEVHAKPGKGRNGWFKGPVDANKPESLLMGFPIEKRIQLENTTIPLIVTRCIKEVEDRGMLFEGIYRKSGARSQIQTIEEAFEKSFDNADFDEVLSGDIAGVTSALKQYLRYLPNSLIHIDHYDNFVEAAKHDQATSIEKLRYVINSLPPAYKDCLNFVIHHLSKVARDSEKNLMTSRNLAVCFAPTLVRHTEGEREILDMQPRNDGTQLLIEHYEKIFTDFL